MSESTQPESLFPDLPAPTGHHWRPHTGALLARHHPQEHATVIELLREGTSIADTARQLGKMLDRNEEGQQDGLRKIVRAWAIAARLDLTDISRMKAALLRDEALEAGLKLTPNAKVKDLGAVAMTLTQANQVERTLGGMPTDIKITTKLTLADLHAMKAQKPTPETQRIRDV